MYLPAPAHANIPVIFTPSTVFGAQWRAMLSGSTAPATLAWPTANKAIYVPFYVPAPVTVVEMFFISGTTPGTANFDLGIYNENFTLLVSLGATACVNTTDAIQPAGGGNITDVVLQRGRYYMAMSAAAVTITTRRWAPTNGVQRAMGLQMQLTAHPLPATATPAAATDAYIPLIGVSAVTTIL